MDTSNKILQIAQQKINLQVYDEKPEVKEEKKKPKKTEKQIFYIPNK